MRGAGRGSSSASATARWCMRARRRHVAGLRGRGDSRRQGRRYGGASRSTAARRICSMPTARLSRRARRRPTWPMAGGDASRDPAQSLGAGRAVRRAVPGRLRSAGVPLVVGMWLSLQGSDLFGQGPSSARELSRLLWTTDVPAARCEHLLFRAAHDAGLRGDRPGAGAGAQSTSTAGAVSCARSSSPPPCCRSPSSR